MGTEMYFQKADGDLFEMGKTRTGWYDFMTQFRGDPQPLSEIEEVALALADGARELGSWEEGTDFGAVGWELAEKLKAWAGDELIVALYDSADPVDTARITGTRYDE